MANNKGKSGAGATPARLFKISPAIWGTFAAQVPNGLRTGVLEILMQDSEKIATALKLLKRNPVE